MSELNDGFVESVEYMPEMINLTWPEVQERAIQVRRDIWASVKTPITAYAVPNGGIPAALVISGGTYNAAEIKLVEDPDAANIYIDDVFDSGNTILKIRRTHGNKQAFFLVDKSKERKLKAKWISFPWERMSKDHPSGPEDNVRRLIQFIREDPDREGLRDTPKRVVKAWKELFSGYGQDPASVLTIFEDGACDEMVLLKDIEFVSHCEHHLLPFMGRAHIGYIPDGKVIGVSKLVRLLEIFSKRMQIQERLTQQVTEALDKYLVPKGSACVIEASHMCMVCRGVRKQHSKMITSSLTGIFKKDPAARAEFMSFVKS